MANNQQRTLLGHPIGLFVLFFTEMWERFSYYGMRALLMLYMVNYFKWTQEHASGIYKWYTSLVYLTPLLGGYLADKYLGNKRAIIIGATLMAIGHFAMAFEDHLIFYAALILLILGNGFFKPNMSVQVGRLYPQNDPRRDSAYTIFYMGINLGAFLSPLICGWLAVNTEMSYHAGFGAAGIGMVLGLVCYLVGLRWVQELPDDAEYHGPEVKEKTPEDHYMNEEEAARTPSVIAPISAMAPQLFYLLALLSIVGAVALWYVELLKPDDALAFGLGGAFTSVMGAYVLGHVSLALRDRVLVIFMVGVFVVFFWSAFEQAGNAMNLFADKTTDRYLTETAPITVYPEVVDATADGNGAEAPTFLSLAWWKGMINPVPTAWFQSINALAIFTLAPLFAWLWVYLPRRGISLSIPAKVGIGVLLQGFAFALMMWSISYENQPSSVPLPALPTGVVADEDLAIMFRDAPDLADDEAFELFDEIPTEPANFGVVHGRRIRFDESGGKLDMTGVLADTDRDRLLRSTVESDFLQSVRDLARATEAADPADLASNGVSVTLESVPDGFDLRYSGFPADEVDFDSATGTLTARVELLDKDYKSLLVAGADPEFRGALGELYVESAKFKVTSWWLFWFYILCTIGELCLSPVGLSMVSKLAPARFATMLMGVWLMTSFFGNYVAGFAGENYGVLHPSRYFIIVGIVVGGAALVCFLFVHLMTRMMHGVK